MTFHQHPTENAAIENTARVILERFFAGLDSPITFPVPVDMIVRAQFGLQWKVSRLELLEDHVPGTLDVASRIIHVDRRCGRHLFMFTLAHELGHWVLHEGDPSLELLANGDPKASVRCLLRSARAETEPERRWALEREANRFAAALLVPSSLLFHETRNYREVDAEVLRQLAGQFDVSLRCMLYRIMDLAERGEWQGSPINRDSLKQLHRSLNHSQKDSRQISGMNTVSHASGEVFAPLVALMNRASNDEWRSLLALNLLAGRDDAKHRGSTDLAQGVRQCVASVTVVGDYLRSLRKITLDGAGRKTPMVIEFAGMPNAGKDSLMQIISDYLQDAHAMRVRIVDEAIKLCHMDRSLNSERLLKSVALTVARLYEARFENPGDYEFVFLNRGVFDRVAFIRTALMQDYISQRLETVHTDYLLSYAHLQDVVFLLLISPEESLRREQESRGQLIARLAERDRERLPAGRIHNLEALRFLDCAYRHTYDKYKTTFQPIYLLGLTDGDQVGIAERTIQLLEVILPNNTGQLPLPVVLDSCPPRFRSPQAGNPIERQSRSGSDNESRSEPQALNQLCFLPSLDL